MPERRGDRARRPALGLLPLLLGVVLGVGACVVSAYTPDALLRTPSGVAQNLVVGVNDVSVDSDWLKIQGIGSPPERGQNAARFTLQADASLVYSLSPRIALGVRGGADTLHIAGDVFAGGLLRFTWEPYEATR